MYPVIASCVKLDQWIYKPDGSLSISAPWCRSGNPAAAFQAPPHLSGACHKFPFRLWFPPPTYDYKWTIQKRRREKEKEIFGSSLRNIIHLQVRITSVLVTSPRLKSWGCKGTEKRLSLQKLWIQRSWFSFVNNKKIPPPSSVLSSILARGPVPSRFLAARVTWNDQVISSKSYLMDHQVGGVQIYNG